MIFDELENWIMRIENGQVSNAETAVSDIITLYKIAGGQINLLKELQQRTKLLLSEIIAETGQVDWQTEAGKTYIPRPSVSIRYDAKKLDALCESDSELARRLAPFRKETERAGSLTIR